MHLNHACEAAIILPAYQPDARLQPYVWALQNAGFKKIVVVDDGSGDKYTGIFDALAELPAAHVIRYPKNRGKGVALKTGMKYILDECPEYEYILTADSDGQHTVDDVLRMCQRLVKQPDGLLLGSRDFSLPNVPKKSRYGNRITTAVFFLLYGQKVMDTQTGLRGFSRAYLPHMLGVKGDRYEYEMNVLIDCALGKIPIHALPIETVYEGNNEKSHFRPLQDAVRIYRVILSGFFRFTASSVISFGIDYVIFVLLNDAFKAYVPGLEFTFRILVFTVLARVGLATAMARIVSGLVNFFFNKKLVFEDHTSIRVTLPRYLCVFLLLMLLSGALTSNLHLLVDMPEKTAKIMVDVVLFFLSYVIQRKWVFVKKRGKHPVPDVRA